MNELEIRETDRMLADRMLARSGSWKGGLGLKKLALARMIHNHLQAEREAAEELRVALQSVIDPHCDYDWCNADKALAAHNAATKGVSSE